MLGSPKRIVFVRSDDGSLTSELKQCMDPSLQKWLISEMAENRLECNQASWKSTRNTHVFFWWPPPKNLCFQQKQWYLQCFRHILACRFGKLLLGGSQILIIYKIWMTCKEETLKIQLSSSSCPILPQNWKTEKLKNWIHMENLFLDLSGKFSFSVFQFLRKYSGIVP